MRAVADPVGLSLIVAMGRRREIGRAGRLLFALKADMAHFLKATAGKPLVMGRKTWDSLPKRPLPKRPNIVATRNLAFMAPGAFVFSGLPPALAAARAMAARTGAGEAVVIGGAEIYAAALEEADRIWLTDVDAEAEADAYFPDFDRGGWREVSAVSMGRDADNAHTFVIRELVRKK